MITRVIMISLVALYLVPIASSFSTNRTQSPQPTHTTHAPQSTPASKALRIFIEEDFASAQRLKRELIAWFDRFGKTVILVEKESEAYDFRILLASDNGSNSGTCSSTCVDGPPPSSCSVTVWFHFVSAVVLTPENKLQFTETGVGSGKTFAITTLARKMAKRFSVLTDTKTKTTNGK